jgi:hypothetical protein
MRAYFAEKNAVKRDEIAARQLHAPRQQYTGKLWLSDVREMFEQMRDHATDPSGRALRGTSCMRCAPAQSVKALCAPPFTLILSRAGSEAQRHSP